MRTGCTCSNLVQLCMFLLTCPCSETPLMQVDDNFRTVPLTTRSATSAQRLHAQIMGYIILTPAKFGQILDWVNEVQVRPSLSMCP